nr:type II toxin-antitoxin system death-on-curing family toxin [Roseomonas marmotae]
MEADAVAFLHDQALREYGGAQGLKDPGLLESALGRPVNKLAYAGAGEIDLFDLAAAYAFGIASNHAFNDANKRTGWSCCVLFLKVNGIELDVTAADVVQRMLDLVNGVIDEAAFSHWLRQHRRTAGVS